MTKTKKQRSTGRARPPRRPGAQATSNIRKQLATITVGVVVALLSAGAIWVVARVVHAAHRRVVLRIRYLEISATHAHDAWEISASAVNEGGLNAYGCSIVVRRINRFAVPTSFDGNEVVGVHGWPLLAHSVHAFRSILKLSDVESLTYHEIWLECASPRSSSNSEVVGTDALSSSASWLELGTPACRSKIECAARSIELRNYIHTARPIVVGGTGSDPTQGSGVFSGKSFTARDALIFVTGTGLQLEVYDRRRICANGPASTLNKDIRWIQVDFRKDPSDLWGVVLGRPTPGLIASYNTARSFTDYASLVNRTELIVTRIDTHQDGLWHGRLVLGPGAADGDSHFAGTFAARWCDG